MQNHSFTPSPVSKFPSFRSMWVKLASSVNMLKESLPSSHELDELYQPSQTFTVITFPWFLLCDSCLVNIAAEIHYLMFSLPALSFSSPLGECQSTTCGLFQSAVNSCWALLHCIFVAHRCVILPSGLKRLPLFTVVRCDFDQREKAVCPQRRASCSGVPWRSVHGSSGCCWLQPYGDKSKCHWWLRAFVRCLWLCQRDEK